MATETIVQIPRWSIGAPVPLTQGRVTLRQVEAKNQDEQTKYEVRIDGELIGEVMKERVEHWDSSDSGTYRINTRGASVWKCALTGEWPDRCEYMRRFDAIAELVRDHERLTTVR